MITRHPSSIWAGIFLLPALLFFTFSASANPRLAWETETLAPSITARLSTDMLQRLTNRIMTSENAGPEILIFKLHHSGNKTAAGDVSRKLEEMPAPVTVAALAARLQLHLAIYRATPRIQTINAVKHDARTLAKMWHAYSRGPEVLAENSAATARALFAADQVTDSQSIRDALAVLTFAERKLMGSHGAWHRFDTETARPSMDGQLADNVALGLAFYDGYKATGNRRWLEKAQQLTDFIVNRLYDRKLGGFFFVTVLLPDFIGHGICLWPINTYDSMAWHPCYSIGWVKRQAKSTTGRQRQEVS